MTIRNKIILTVLLLLATIAVALVIGTLSALSYADHKLSQKLDAITLRTGWQIESEASVSLDLGMPPILRVEPFTLELDDKNRVTVDSVTTAVNTRLIGSVLDGDYPKQWQVTLSDVAMTDAGLQKTIENWQKTKSKRAGTSSQISRWDGLLLDLRVDRYALELKTLAINSLDDAPTHIELTLNNGQLEATALANAKLMHPMLKEQAQSVRDFPVKIVASRGGEGGYQVSLEASDLSTLTAIVKNNEVTAQNLDAQLKYNNNKIELSSTVKGTEVHTKRHDFLGVIPIPKIKLTAELELAQKRLSKTTIYLHKPQITVDLDKLKKHQKYANVADKLEAIAALFDTDTDANLLEDDDEDNPPANDIEPKHTRKKRAHIQYDLPAKIAKLNDVLQRFRHKISAFTQKAGSLPTISIDRAQLQMISHNKKLTLNNISIDSKRFANVSNSKININWQLEEAQGTLKVAFDRKDKGFSSLEVAIAQLSAQNLLNLIQSSEDNHGTLDARILIERQEDSDEKTPDNFTLNASLSLHDFGFSHPKLSSAPLQHINAKASLSATYDAAKDRLTIPDAHLILNQHGYHAKLTLDQPKTDPSLDYQFDIDTIECAKIPDIIPDGMLPDIDDLKMTGAPLTLSIYGKLPFNQPLKFTLKVKGWDHTQCHPLRIEPHDPARLNQRNYTFTFTDYTTREDGITVGPGTPSFTPLSHLPPYLAPAMYLTEDVRFFEHGPFKPTFIARAIRLNLKHGRYVYGGSTITQQLVKNLFLNRNKNLARKLEEAFIAWQLETVVPKERILELYVNMIEFGSDTYGVQNAARHYFGKNATQLSPLEAAFLASLKVSPKHGDTFLSLGKIKRPWWLKRQRYILHTLAKHGYISAPEILAEFPYQPPFKTR